MSPSIPISRFVDPEEVEPSTPTRPTVRTAEEATWLKGSVQLRVQLAEDTPSPPVELSDEEWVADGLVAAEMARTPTCGALTRAGTACKQTVPYAGARCTVHCRPVFPRLTAAQHVREFQRLAEGDTPEFCDFTCGARTRVGTSCRKLGLWPNGRCKFHGGLSTGPRTEQGRRQSALNGRKGGRPCKRVGGKDAETYPLDGAAEGHAHA